MRKKISLVLALVLVALLAVSATALAEVKLGQALYAAHGTKAFCVATVAVEDDVILSAIIDEYQFLAPEGFVPVPNAETFTDENGQVLASKRQNNEGYSALMADHAQATDELLNGYMAIEAFVTGKTVAELEELLAGKEGAEVLEMVDAVASCTLVDALGYIEAIIMAAKSI